MSDSTDDIPQEIMDADRGPSILGAILAVSVLSTMFTCARLYVRGRILGKFHLDDWLIIIAVLSGWANVALAILAVKHGNGRHVETLTQSQQEDVTFWTLVGFPLGILSFGLPKLAVVALLTRIMNPSRWHKIWLWFMTIACNLVLAGNAIFLLGRCRPAESLWNFDIEGTCWDPQMLVDYAITSGALSAFVDFYLAVYPGFVLTKLKMNLKKKIALTVALGIGLVSTVVAIYKTTRLPMLASENFSWDTADLVIWTITEGAAMIIAACIPVLQPLTDIIFGKRAFGSYGEGYGAQQKYMHRYYASNGGGANYSVDIKSSANHHHKSVPSGAGMHSSQASASQGGAAGATAAFNRMRSPSRPRRPESSETLMQSSDEESGVPRPYGVQADGGADKAGRIRGVVKGLGRTASRGGHDGNRSRSGTANGAGRGGGGVLSGRERSSTEGSYEMQVTTRGPLSRGDSQDGILAPQGAAPLPGVAVGGGGGGGEGGSNVVGSDGRQRLQRQQSSEPMGMPWPGGAAGIMRTDEVRVSYSYDAGDSMPANR